MWADLGSTELSMLISYILPQDVIILKYIVWICDCQVPYLIKLCNCKCGTLPISYMIWYRYGQKHGIQQMDADLKSLRNNKI